MPFQCHYFGALYTQNPHTLTMGRVAKLEPQWDNSRSRWYVSLPVRLSPTGKRTRKFFCEKEEARIYSKRVKLLEERSVQLVRKASPEVIETAVHYEELFQLYGFSGLKAACLHFEAHLNEIHKSYKFEDLLVAFEEEHFQDWGEVHQRSWETLKTLCQIAVDQPISLLTTAFWRKLLRDTANERKWAARSFNYYVGRISAIYVWGCKNKYCEENPTEAIKRRKEIKKAVSILSPEQTSLILNDAWQYDREMVPYFAIGIFAGLRPESELEALDWEDINFEEKWIRVGFENKTETKRFVPIEDNLLSWLQPWINSQGRVCPSSNLIKRRRAITRGKYQAKEGTLEKDWLEIASWKARDIMRHSYGSNLEAKYKDRNAIKENMGHTNFKTYDQHYRNARTPKQAESFWSIYPPECV